MFKYIKFNKVETADTVLEFRGESETVKVNHFDVNVVSIESESEEAIDTLIAAQVDEIECKEIDKDEFKSMVSESAQLNRIRGRVKHAIAKKYDTADEIAMSKRDKDDAKRVAYESYVLECVSMGKKLKEEIGY